MHNQYLSRVHYKVKEGSLNKVIDHSKDDLTSVECGKMLVPLTSL